VAQKEHVLVIERKTFEKAGIFQGLQFDTAAYLDEIFAAGNAAFMDRHLAEKDPGYKQIIPYVIMTCNGRYLSYVRGSRAGEKRLVGNRSIGIGGHINPLDDMPLFNSGFYETYLTAVQREVAEEVNVQVKHTDHIAALLNDESNEVGSVHLGIVHCWQLDAPDVSKREQMITQMAFMTPAELEKVRPAMETWSSLCLSHLDQIANSALSRARSRDNRQE